MAEKANDIKLYTEREVEMYLVAELKKIHVCCLKWVCPGTNGVPDRIVLGNHGNIYFVELKRPKRSHTEPLQKRWQTKLKSRGFHACIVHNREEVDRFVSYVKRDEEKGAKI